MSLRGPQLPSWQGRRQGVHSTPTQEPLAVSEQTGEARAQHRTGQELCVEGKKSPGRRLSWNEAALLTTVLPFRAQ